MTSNAVFTAAELNMIARALHVRADTFARVAMMSATVPDYEIATRAARRHRALAKRIAAARSGTEPGPPAAVIAPDRTGNRNAGGSREADRSAPCPGSGRER
ncbi:hypothetical protein Acsp03_71430 [Actinomadura sp. NBRC 104412]|uniref:hypothetical protein n=1 Tax=Actinomadura sp. NBRC 104412 TaxID=3032203 RepID=UPI0024A1B914|nr:hypothetical protein [Actinomadura sp. NBRC 104412]GLZ09677.1 hypothetical protein Acsp03_71430 [Actinomadura sp. NBRC 104412]